MPVVPPAPPSAAYMLPHDHSVGANSLVSEGWSASMANGHVHSHMGMQPDYGYGVSSYPESGWQQQRQWQQQPFMQQQQPHAQQPHVQQSLPAALAPAPAQSYVNLHQPSAQVQPTASSSSNQSASTALFLQSLLQAGLLSIPASDAGMTSAYGQGLPQGPSSSPGSLSPRSLKVLHHHWPVLNIVCTLLQCREAEHA